MGSMTRRLAACSIVFALVVSACTPASDSTRDTEVTSEQVSDTTDDPGTGDTSGTPADTEAPPLPVLFVSSPVVYAGAAITVTADAQRTGMVTMGFGEDIIASEAMTDGAATITVPEMTTPGTYLLGGGRPRRRPRCRRPFVVGKHTDMDRVHPISTRHDHDIRHPRRKDSRP